MRVLQICQRPERRGAEIFAYQLSGELERRGHQVLNAYLYPYDDEPRVPLRVQDRVLGGDLSHPLETTIGFRPSLLVRVRRLLSEFQPDITQLNGARSLKYGVLGSIANGRAGAVVYRNIGSVTDWVRGPRRRAFYGGILRGLDGAIAISEGSRTALSGILSPSTPVTVISNAFDPASLQPRSSREAVRSDSRTPAGSPVILYLGALGPEKRVDRLVEAVSHVRANGADLHLWVVGDGPLRPDLERQTEDEGLSAVTRFFGARDDVGSFLAAADMLALTSDTEGVPGVLLEAAYHGLPVVATRVGGVAECVADGETGLLVEAGDRTSLSRALARLTEDSGLRDRLGSAGRERVLAQHSIEAIAHQFLEFFGTVRANDLQ